MLLLRHPLILGSGEGSAAGLDRGPGLSFMERMTGIEPAYSAWEPVVVPTVLGLTSASGRTMATVVDRAVPGFVAALLLLKFRGYAAVAGLFRVS